MLHLCHDHLLVTIFRKPYRVPLMPMGDVETRSPLGEEVVYQSKCCIYVKDGSDLRCVNRPNQTCTTTLHLMGQGIIDYLVRYWHGAYITSDRGDMSSHSRHGRAWIGGHDYFYRASDTLLVPSCRFDDKKGRVPRSL